MLEDLAGGAGANLIVGGTGSDIMIGGGGADTFVYNLGDGSDRITDFSFAAGDRVDLTGTSFIGTSGGGTYARLSADGGVTVSTIWASSGYVWTGAEFI